MIYFNSIILLHNSSVIEVFVDLVLSQSMLYVTLFDLLSPSIIEMMNLAGNLSAIFEIISLVDL